MQAMLSHNLCCIIMFFYFSNFTGIDRGAKVAKNKEITYQNVATSVIFQSKKTAS